MAMQEGSRGRISLLHHCTSSPHSISSTTIDSSSARPDSTHSEAVKSSGTDPLTEASHGCYLQSTNSFGAGGRNCSSSPCSLPLNLSGRVRGLNHTPEGVI